MTRLAVAEDPRVEAPAGLKNLVVTRTTISDVLGRRGAFHYRGYDAIELTERATTDDVWFLLHEGRLPEPDQREDFAARVGRARELPDGLADLLPGIARGGAGTLDALRTALSAAGQLLGCRTWLDQPSDVTREQTLRLAALMPVIAAAIYRLRSGADPIAPRAGLGYAANHFLMVTGREPSPLEATALDRYLALTVEHGFNNSAFTARVIASSGADVGAAMSGALGALSGPLHGGAPALVCDMLDAIGEPSRAALWMDAELRAGRKLMGFGHAVYKTTDPRSTALHEFAKRLGGERVAFAEVVEQAGIDALARHRPQLALKPNVEFYAGVVLEAIGLPRETFTPTFACSRAIGWAANICEQVADNKIVRPVARYEGPPWPRPIPDA